MKRMIMILSLTCISKLTKNDSVAVLRVLYQLQILINFYTNYKNIKSIFIQELF